MSAYHDSVECSGQSTFELMLAPINEANWNVGPPKLPSWQCPDYQLSGALFVPWIRAKQRVSGHPRMFGQRLVVRGLR